MSLIHSSTRRPPALKETDYDHEITLVDHTKRRSIPGPSFSVDEPRTPSLEVPSTSSSRRHSDAPLRRARSKLHNEVAKRRYKNYQDRRLGDGGAEDEDGEERDEEVLDDPSPPQSPGGSSRGRNSATLSASQRKAKKQSPPESSIDILYENQRGAFLCGIPLFSSKALGNLDPSPWSNAAFKTSATSPANAQVPDPSWVWAWKEWVVNHSDEVDDDGWEYSFAFAKYFNWHGPTWWNSFVRRRAWIRKRLKVGRDAGGGAGSHALTSDYFTVDPRPQRSRSRGSTVDGGSVSHRISAAELAKRELEDDELFQDIRDINTLMKALRSARIDREKMEAVESFIANGGEELYYLRERMHDIMKMFIFQASRRLLLAHIVKIIDAAMEELDKDAQNGTELDPAKKQRLDNLEEAVKEADKEVKKLEFWSDVREMTEKGEIKGAADHAQGWDDRWTGLDNSGPKDVPNGGKAGEGNGLALAPGSEKGKQKAEV